MAENLTELIVQEFRKWAVMSPTEILREFQDRFGAQVYEDFYAYRQGSNELPLLIAHVDTVWSSPPCEDEIIYDQEANEIRLEASDEEKGVGADDRLGVAMIALLLREFPNVGFLLTNYEEPPNYNRRGQRGSEVAAQNLREELQRYPYLLELDRRGINHFAHYGHINRKFEAFLTQNLPEWGLLRGTYTDITFICPVVNRCGVNIAIGYYNQHCHDEFVKVDDAVLAYQAVRKLLQHPVQKPFEWRGE